MSTLLISLCVCFALLAAIFLFVWHNTDWEKIDRANQRFIDADGTHAYYDRHLLDQQK